MIETTIPLNSLLVYNINVSTPLILEFNLLDFDPKIKEFFKNKLAFYDLDGHSAIVAAPKLYLSQPGEGTMGITQYIRGFAGSNEHDLFGKRFIHFKSNHERDVYAIILQRLLHNMIIAVERLKNSSNSPRIVLIM